MANKNSLTQEYVDGIFERSNVEVTTILGKLTVVTAQLPNGWIISESSGCADPANYDEALGAEICKKRIKDKIWELEGYLLQTHLSLRGE